MTFHMSSIAGASTVFTDTHPDARPYLIYIYSDGAWHGDMSQLQAAPKTKDYLRPQWEQSQCTVINADRSVFRSGRAVLQYAELDT